jgi:HAD superfamily hydrolase (TIGR01509 family)
MLRGIVFDLDGTLVDSLSVTFDAFNYGLTQMGGKAHTPQEIMHYFGTGEDEIFAAILGRDKAASAYEAFQSYFDQNLGKIPLHPGVKELLNSIQQADIPTSIFTGRSWITTEMILNYHHLTDQFVTIVANDHVNNPKPSPEGLLLAASRMKLKPEEVLFIGDSPVDIIASRAAGSQGVAALWDLLSARELLEPHDPHHWAEHPSDVWKVWKENS